jgi:type IV secretion system protein TrbL
MAASARAMRDRVASAAGIAPASSTAGEAAADEVGTSAASNPASDASDNAPAWAKRLHRRQRLAQGASTAAHVVRSAEHGGSGAHPDLHDSSNE